PELGAPWTRPWADRRVVVGDPRARAPRARLEREVSVRGAARATARAAARAIQAAGRPRVADPGLVERSIASGVSAWLTKPIDTRELEGAIGLAAVCHAELEALEAEVAKARQRSRTASSASARRAG